MAFGPTSYPPQLDRFDLLIDWGWFYFITKPMFFVIDWLYRLVGNFGTAILLVTVLIKMPFFSLFYLVRIGQMHCRLTTCSGLLF